MDGRSTPIQKILAFWYGIQDGFRQPYDAGYTLNVDHLGIDAQEIQDAGINLGQYLRAGNGAQSHTEYGYTPLFLFKRH